MVIGVTGKYCSGKNVVSCILTEHGFTEIDVDKIGHQVLENQARQVIRTFGSRILDQAGKIDRKKLAKIVFKSKKQRIRLEHILHPLMKTRIQNIIKKNNENYVINAALLFQMQLHGFCDFIIYIKAPFWVRVNRALSRDKLSIWNILRRFFSQFQIFTKLKLPGVDIYYEYNKESIQKLEKRILGILKQRHRGEG
ncbi:MAG: dephospho-CoA kinase [Spirochaetales bacterium]|nr:dephospho-CoA kinase [Spirochaetales bacterium]